MTESVVEKVAMAIATARAGRENAEESRFKGGNLWFEAKRDARAAIEAMREPTWEMAAAGVTGYAAGDPDEPFYGSGVGMKDAWRRMIDAALSPGEQDG